MKEVGGPSKILLFLRTISPYKGFLVLLVIIYCFFGIVSDNKELKTENKRLQYVWDAGYQQYLDHKKSGRCQSNNIKEACEMCKGIIATKPITKREEENGNFEK